MVLEMVSLPSRSSCMSLEMTDLAPAQSMVCAVIVGEYLSCWLCVMVNAAVVWWKTARCSREGSNLTPDHIAPQNLMRFSYSYSFVLPADTLELPIQGCSLPNSTSVAMSSSPLGNQPPASSSSKAGLSRTGWMSWRVATRDTKLPITTRYQIFTTQGPILPSLIIQTKPISIPPVQSLQSYGNQTRRQHPLPCALRHRHSAELLFSDDHRDEEVAVT